MLDDPAVDNAPHADPAALHDVAGRLQTGDLAFEGAPPDGALHDPAPLGNEVQGVPLHVGHRLQDGLVQLFRRFDARAASAPSRPRLRPSGPDRVALCRATREGADYQGRGVHAAARIAAVAGADEIIASRDALADAKGFRCSEGRNVHLKGISEPVEVVSVDWR